MSKSIEDLREALFATLQGVKDGTIDVEKARAVNELGKTICDTAKVEVDYIKASGGGESTFLSGTVGADNLPPGITGITQHRLRG
jgi:hypothetical protein